jgi:type VI secretion system secreted protein Hcp
MVPTNAADPYGSSGSHLLVEAYWKCDGIENECEIKGKEKYSRIIGFEWGLASPVDTHSGMASGRRQHRPVLIRKMLDKSTPLIMQAIADNKKLDKSEIIVCQVFGKDARKIDKFKVSLEGVRFIECATIGGQDGASVVDNLKMAFDKITYEDIPAKKIATDDWREI